MTQDAYGKRFEELNDMAWRGLPVPNTRSQSEILAFQELRNLYAFANANGLSMEQGKREKSQIFEAFRINRFLEELQESTSNMWRRIDLAAAEYNKNPSVEKADALMKEIYKVERKT